MSGLTIIVATADPARLYAALSVAAAHAALDKSTRLFLQGDVVSLLKAPIHWAEDDRYFRAGIPTLGELLEEALALGVNLIACQSGLALAGMTTADLPTGVTTGGLIALLSKSGDDQLLMA